ncbi:MAG: hypothetical protein GX833_04250 [Clostridium sp.]|nr:hypothetical protein [Clostridium sp.]
MNKTKSKIERKIMIIKRGVWMMAFLVALSGCQIQTKPSTSPEGSSSTSVSDAKELTDASSLTNSLGQGQSTPSTVSESTKTPETSQPVVSTTTGSSALVKYKDSRESLQSEKMTHLWSVESNFPLKTGQIIHESNFDVDGNLTTGWGQVEETEGVESLKTTWYQTKAELVIEEAGGFQRYPLDQVQNENKYDFNRLLEKVLTDYSVSKENKEFFVKLTTQDENLIQELMEYLGYRKAEQDAYQGNLYLEARLDEVSGNLLTINYVFKQRIAGYTDNGSISFKDWNIPVSVVIPEEAREAGEP